ncbi:hypothetical protein [Sphingopyxis sp.]|jgi:hypothetical protein|uniref:hypothetical protein n=1 Tax=Sphingopyxis sp. TaxID=1908224 RepID=UPI002DEEFA40|nr:hypothetical protein [Sphingopyxis sp.]
MSDGADFSFNGMDVGYFEGPSPTQGGRARYMPFRGPGHYELQQALKADARPRCTYLTNGIEITFEVLNCPEYGVLDLGNFSGA